jgi:hypothetical protein
MNRAREQQLLTRKFSRDTAAPLPLPPQTNFPNSAPAGSPPPTESRSIDIGDMIENLHPVNLVGGGCALAGAVILLIGLIGMFDYYGTDYLAKISKESLELGIAERPSGFSIFLHNGLLPWIETLYGAALLTVSVFFLQKQAQARQALGWMLWAFIAYVPAYYLTAMISHFFESIRPSFWTFAVEFLQMVVVTALVGFPLYLLINFLEDKRIRSVVRL